MGANSKVNNQGDNWMDQRKLDKHGSLKKGSMRAGRREVNSFFINLQKDSVQNKHLSKIFRLQKRLEELDEAQKKERTQLLKRKDQNKQVKKLLQNLQFFFCDSNKIDPNSVERLTNLTIKANLAKLRVREKDLQAEVNKLKQTSQKLDIKAQVAEQKKIYDQYIELVQRYNKLHSLRKILIKRTQKKILQQTQTSLLEQVKDQPTLDQQIALKLSQNYTVLNQIEQSIRETSKNKFRLSLQIQQLSEQVLYQSSIKSKLAELQSKIEIWSKKFKEKNSLISDIKKRRIDLDRQTIKYEEQISNLLKSRTEQKKDQQQREIRLLQEQISKVRMAHDEINQKLKKLMIQKMRDKP